MILRISLLFMLALVAPATAGNVFAIDKIRVDVRADSATQARRLGITRAQKSALQQVLRRVTRATDWPKLDEIALPAAETLVKDFRVTQEKRSGTRYLATLSFTFKANQIRQILTEAELPIVTTQGEPVLVLPVLEGPDSLELWRTHWWRKAWDSQDLSNHTVPVFMPSNDLDDEQSATPEQVLLGNAAAIQALSQRYGTARVLVVHAIGDVANELSIRSILHGPDGMVEQIYKFDGEQAEIGPQAVVTILDALATPWKRQAAILATEQLGLLVKARYPNFAGWQDLLTRLEAADLVRRVELHEVSIRQSFFTLAHIGSLAQLQANLRRQNLALEDQGGYWELLQMAGSARR